MKLSAPIPGMSLTREPGNAPWEQPPLHNTVEEALAYYLDKLDDEDILDQILFSLEADVPVASIVDFMTSHSVMEGYHTVDVKMLVAPVLHEYIVSLAEAADIPYVESFAPSKEKRQKKRDLERQKTLLTRMLEREEPEAPSQENLEEAGELLAGEEQPDQPFIQRRM